MGPLSIAPNCANLFTYFGKGWSLSRSNACVCSCIGIYSVFTKEIAVYKSRSGNVALAIMLGVFMLKQTALLTLCCYNTVNSLLTQSLKNHINYSTKCYLKQYKLSY